MNVHSDLKKSDCLVNDKNKTDWDSRQMNKTGMESTNTQRQRTFFTV